MSIIMNKRLTVLVGPPGSGKSTLAKEYCSKGGVAYVNQDSQGKDHLTFFQVALHEGKDVVVDRMGFSKEQRARYIKPAQEAGYYVHIVVLHQPRKVCFERIMKRENHETIKDASSANSALNLFFSKYEKPTPDEADKIDFRYPEGDKPKVIVCDLDGTLCNLDNRLHHVRKPQGEKKDWKSFFMELEHDEPNWPVAHAIKSFIGEGKYQVVFASGRPDDYERKTRAWLEKHGFPTDRLYMRCRGDHRQDYIAKEIILDFEILTRYEPVLFIDDRKQVVDFWRSRGYLTFQCAEGEF